MLVSAIRAASLVALAGFLASAGSTPVGAGARVTGLVRFLGDPSKSRPVDFGACPNCSAVNAGKPVAREDLIVNPDGTLRNAVVFVRGTSPALAGRTFPVPEEAVPLEIRGGMFRPRVVGLRTGQTLAIRNVSTCGFNVRGLPRSNLGFNVSLPKLEDDSRKTFDREEVAFRLEDNVHPWMSAWVAVLPHPFFAVTGEEGSFDLGDLPPGEYEVATWHETLGEQAQAFSLGAGETRRVEFSFRPPPRR